MSSEHERQLHSGERFRFGRNWARFLRVLNEERIASAERSLLEMLECADLRGKSFLDAGCGSGLFSLAARRLGARVHSFDYDPESVACAMELRRRYFPDDPGWKIEEGSVLDVEYMRGLGKFDIVYSWGVLHHTGAMWDALGNVTLNLTPGGKLFISIYNDQGIVSERWRKVKAAYNRFSGPVKGLIILTVAGYRFLGALSRRASGFQKMGIATPQRGMSRWHDLIDWVGGYPFEVAKPEQIFDFYRARGLQLTRLVTVGGGHACNNYVLQRVS